MSALVRLKSTYIPVPAHIDALDRLKGRFEHYWRTKEAVGFVIVGGSRSGKSRLLREFKQWLLSNYQFPGASCNPFIGIDIADNPVSTKDIAKGLLGESGEPFYAYQSTKQDLDGRLKVMLDEKSVHVIAFDEFQGLFKGKTANGVKNATQAIKLYFNKLGRFIILSGLEDIIDFILASEELKSRFRFSVRLPEYRIDDKSHMSIYRDFICRIEEVVPFHPDCRFNKSMLLRWYLISDGAIGNIVHFVERACEVAYMHGSENIRMPHLSEAFTTTLDHVSGAFNPFGASDSDVENEAARVLQRMRNKRK